MLYFYDAIANLGVPEPPKRGAEASRQSRFSHPTAALTVQPRSRRGSCRRPPPARAFCPFRHRCRQRRAAIFYLLSVLLASARVNGNPLLLSHVAITTYGVPSQLVCLSLTHLLDRIRRERQGRPKEGCSEVPGQSRTLLGEYLSLYSTLDASFDAQ
jgi:hypothetical protein